MLSANISASPIHSLPPVVQFVTGPGNSGLTHVPLLALIVTGFGTDTRYRYLYGLVTTAKWFNVNWTGYVQNMDLQEAVAGWGGEFCGVAVDEFDGVTPDEIDGV